MNNKFIPAVDKNKFKQNLNLVYNYMMQQVECITLSSKYTKNNTSRNLVTFIDIDKVYKNKSLFVRNLIDTIEEHWKVNNTVNISVRTTYGQTYIHEVVLSEFIKNNCRLANIDNRFKLSAKLIDVMAELLPVDYLPYSVKFPLVLENDLAIDHIHTFEFSVVSSCTNINVGVVKTFTPTPNQTLGDYIRNINIYMLECLDRTDNHYRIKVQFNYPKLTNSIEFTVKNNDSFRKHVLNIKSLEQFVSELLNDDDVIKNNSEVTNETN